MKRKQHELTSQKNREKIREKKLRNKNKENQKLNIIKKEKKVKIIKKEKKIKEKNAHDSSVQNLKKKVKTKILLLISSRTTMITEMIALHVMYVIIPKIVQNG